MQLLSIKKDLLFIKYAHSDILFHMIDSNSMILAFTVYTDLLQTAAFHTQPMVKTIFESDKKSINSFWPKIVEFLLASE